MAQTFHCVFHSTLFIVRKNEFSFRQLDSEYITSALTLEPARQAMEGQTKNRENYNSHRSRRKAANVDVRAVTHAPNMTRQTLDFQK